MRELSEKDVLEQPERHPTPGGPASLRRSTMKLAWHGLLLITTICSLFFLAACLLNRPNPKPFPWPPKTIPTRTYDTTKTIWPSIYWPTAFSTSSSYPTATPYTLTPPPTPTFRYTQIPTHTPKPPRTRTPTITPTATLGVLSLETADLQVNAVAFIAKDWENNGPSSLWIANIDGSGERKLVDQIDEPVDWPRGHILQWSPNGKWISYKDWYHLWVISRNGLVKKNLLTITDESKGILYTYQWSPDSSQIAYLQTDLNAATTGSLAIVGLINVATGQVSELTSYESSVFITLSWTPDGRYIVINPFDEWNSINLLEVGTGAILKITPDNKNGSCNPSYHDSLVWSPTGQHFFYTNHGNGRFATNWICVAGLDGSNKAVPDEGSAYGPVWDKTGSYLYFPMMHVYPNFSVDKGGYFQLMRYNISTHETEPVLLLDAQPVNTGWWHLTISENKQMLEIDAGNYYEYDKSHAFIILNVDTPAKYTVYKVADMQVLSGPVWSADNRNIIFFSGQNETPNHMGMRHYGAFYALDINTGLTNLLSNVYYVDDWAISPVASP